MTTTTKTTKTTTKKIEKKDAFLKLWNNAKELTTEEQEELNRRLHNPWTVTRE